MRSAHKYRAICFVCIGCVVLLVFHHHLSSSSSNDNDHIPQEQTTLDTIRNVRGVAIDHNPIQSNTSMTLLRDQFIHTPYIFDKFTMVTPTYKRTANIPVLLNHYCSMTDLIHKIIILWNNVGEIVPAEIVNQGKNCDVPVVIKIMPRNNLTSRFIPYKEIETAGILSIDDDLQLTTDSIHLAFDTWRSYPYLLVGYTPRWYFNRNNHYKYHHNRYKGKYYMMMTNVAFIHHKYLEMFTDTLPKEIKDYIIKTTNGEDIAMNVVIGKYLTDQGYPQCVAIYVEETGLKEIGNLSKSGYKGLWKRKGHMRQRSQCLNVLSHAYGQLYLHECQEIIKHKSVN